MPEARGGFGRLDRRTFLKTTGVATAGAVLIPSLGCTGDWLRTGGQVQGVVQPFGLAQVRLGAGLLRQKQDRMLHYALNYGGAADEFGGPDRMLCVFRLTAGLDTKGARPPGGWETAAGYLRGHYAGHFMTMLAQSHAATGAEVYKRKLDYMVAGLAECQAALAAESARPTPRHAGRHGQALRLTGSPLGHAEHVRLPDGIVAGLDDFTIATWIRLSVYDAAAFPHQTRGLDPSEQNNGAALFDFGEPNPEFGAAARSRMYLVVRVSNGSPVPRFAITASGADGEQRIDGSGPLPVDEWVHLAVTREGTTGTLWLNGEAVGVNRSMALRPAELGETRANWLGRVQFPQRSVSHLNAELDEFQIYGRALSAAELRSLLDTAGGSPGGGDVAWYRFDEADGPVAIDSSGQGRNGVILAPGDGQRHPGFVSAYPETQFIRLEEFATYGGNQGIWAPYYTLHKILAGLLDARLATGNGQALDVAAGIGDWVHSRLAPLPQAQLDRMWNIYIAGEYGGINESLAQLHALRPRPEYLEAARRFDNNAVYQPIAAGEDVLDGRHANQHIPQFIGYLRIFEQGGGAEYRQAARHFWEMVVPHRIYAHGGMGVGEMFRARDNIAGSLFAERNHAETCPLYNMLKLSRNLFFHDPSPEYMDYYEHGLLNQMAGSRRDADSETSPEVSYFVPVMPGLRRSYGNTGTCCGGTGLESHTKYQDSIYFRAADGSALYVNLYLASTLDWAERGFVIEQVTNYPEEGLSRLNVNGSGRLSIRLRVPAWVRKGFVVRVNGQVQHLDARPGAYVELDRRWAAGDVIEVAMPFSFRTERTIDDPTVQSIFYGPNLLAPQHGPVGGDLASGLLEFSFYRYVKLDGDLAPAMTPAGRPLHFTTHGQRLAPFHVADPQRGETAGYHIYVRRVEPGVVFGAVDSGVRNPAGAGGLTLLDAIWDRAPFQSHEQFMTAVQEALGQWSADGLLAAAETTAILAAARQAEPELRLPAV